MISKLSKKKKARKKNKSNNVIPVFVYGTLKMGCSNNILLRTGTFIGEAFTCKSLYIYSCGIPMVAVPLLSDKKQTRQALPIIGEVYNISERLLCTLDLLEGHPDLYFRTIEEIQIGAETIRAYIYVKNNDKEFLFEESLQNAYFEDIEIVDNKYKWTELDYYDSNRGSRNYT